jgi:hypothetical protein
MTSFDMRKLSSGVQTCFSHIFIIFFSRTPYIVCTSISLFEELCSQKNLVRTTFRERFRLMLGIQTHFERGSYRNPTATDYSIVAYQP